MTTPLVWSERPEPNAPGLRDCTYSAGLTGLVFGGFTKFPLGIYTVAEREALERSDAQPNETGASASDLVVAVKKRYGIEWSIQPASNMAKWHAREDVGWIIGGRNGNLPAGHTLRRWDPGFIGGHRVFIVPTGNGTHVTWFDPEAPMKYPGDLTDWATVSKWMGSFDPNVIAVREDAYAPAPPPEPLTVTKSAYDAAVARAVKAEADLELTRKALEESSNNLSAALARIAAAKTALG